jgi:hypothetical protein
MDMFIGNPSQYENIGTLLSQIQMKFNGRVNLGFIILATPYLSDYDPAAVTSALLELLHDPKPQWWEGAYPDFKTILHRVKNITGDEEDQVERWKQRNGTTD